MAQQGYITEAQAAEAKAKPIQVLDKPKIKTRNASYFLDQVVSYLLDRYGSTTTYRGGLKVYTTLDLNLQRLAEEALLSALPDWFENEDGIMQPQGAMLVMEPQTGYVRAMVGGRGTDKYNRAVQALRQPGSLLKPFVYVTALQEGYTLASIIEDSPVSYRNSDGSTYAPSNYNNMFQGPITLRTALQGSINVATVRLLEQVGIAKVWNVIQSMGITTLNRKDDYNLALALGGISQGVTLMEMCAAYSIFANRGIKVEPIIVEKVVDKDGIVLEHNKPKRSVLGNLSEETMFLIHSALEGVVKSPTGTGRRANISGLAIAGKTGTTNNNTNAWFIGYTPKLLAGVYLGNDAQSQPMIYNGTSITSGNAAEIWATFMKNAVPNNESTSSFAPPPPGITTASIIAETGLLAGPASNGTRINEYFAKGTEPIETCVSYKRVSADICKSSNALATSTCPSVVARTYLDVLVDLPDGSYRPIVLPKDFPTEYCTLHGTIQQ
jgi:penicillin-binding protein 1A